MLTLIDREGERQKKEKRRKKGVESRVQAAGGGAWKLEQLKDDWKINKSS